MSKSESNLDHFKKMCSQDALLEMRISLKKEWLARYGSGEGREVIGQEDKGHLTIDCVETKVICGSLIIFVNCPTNHTTAYQ